MREDGTTRTPDTVSPSSSVAPLSSLARSSAPSRQVDLRDAASRTDWKDFLLALVSIGSMLMLVAQVTGELPGTEPWQSVVGIVLPLVLLVLRRLFGHGPRALRSSALTPTRIGSMVGIGAGLWWLWDAISCGGVVTGLLGIAALGVGAALDRRARIGSDDHREV